MNICFLDQETFNINKESFSPFSQSPFVATYYDSTKPIETLERVIKCEAVFTNKVLIQKEHIELCPNLKYIGVLATGTNNVDLEYAKSRGVVVKNVVGYSTTSVAQHTLGFIIALAGHSQSYSREIHKWPTRSTFTGLNKPFTELYGKTIGLIGYGSIGKQVAHLAKAFSMRVLIAESLIRNKSDSFRTPLDKLLQESDFVSIHCPLTDHSKELVDRQFLNQMKETAYLINTSRGTIVNESDLCLALKNGEIAGAALDVLVDEPPKNDNPLISLNHSNLIITPHIAWASQESQLRLVQLAYKNFKDFLNKHECR